MPLRDLRLTVAGHDYFKVPVEETFTRDAAHAAWKNQGEQGEAAKPGRALYWPFNALPSDAAVLVGALQRAPGGALPLLPAGEARLERLGERTLTAGNEKRVVTQYALTGLGFSPGTVWLDADGLLADTGGGGGALPEAGEDARAPALGSDRDPRRAALRSPRAAR